MANYFPYSYIILNAYNNVKESINRHAFFGEWSVYEQKPSVSPATIVSIGEIYY